MSLSSDHPSAVTTLCYPEQANEAVSSTADSPISHLYSPPSDETSISTLIHSESLHLPLPDHLHRCRHRPLYLTARQDSINWILKVHAFHHFKPVTALLSVNYFDRFLSSHSLPEANGWPFQLLSVACLSLAAKMEEPQVPLLLDLQLFQPRFVFEPKTVQRMELRVMSVLDWRLNSITPFHCLPYFISELPSSASDPDSSIRIFTSSSDLILKSTRVVDFLSFAPSTIAAAAVLCAAGTSPDLIFHERMNQEMVRSCHQLMVEYLVDTCPSAELKDDRRAEPQPQPPSPVGVLDAATCGSCDTRPDNPGSISQAEPEAEPSNNKRPRLSAPDVQQP